MGEIEARKNADLNRGIISGCSEIDVEVFEHKEKDTPVCCTRIGGVRILKLKGTLFDVQVDLGSFNLIKHRPQNNLSGKRHAG